MYIEGASLYAEDHDLLMLWVNIVTIAAFVIVNSVLIYFVIHYRRRSPERKTSAKDSSAWLEFIWTAFPTVVLAIFFVWGLTTFFKLREVPKGAMEILVTAKQWTWQFTYPAKLRQNSDNPQDSDKSAVLKSTNTLYLQAGQPTKLVMKSSDVIHSFFVPAFRIKEDVVPNIYTYLSFTPILGPSAEGKGRVEYDIFCTEYCGKDHSAMIGKAVVLQPAAFHQEMERIEAEAGDIDAGRGERIHASNCISCHSLDGSPLVGPSFKGLWQKERRFVDGSSAIADENYIRSSILNPNDQVVEDYPAAMPVQDYSDEEILSIIEYIKSLP